MSASPHASPLMGNSRRLERHHSASPPQQLSKRDKRRTMLSERLAEITASFSQNRDLHYREQLQAIQIDMNLIMEADVHAATALPNDPGDIDDLVKENIGKTMMKGVGPHPPPRAGRMYSVFAMEVNNAMEERDAALSVHMRDYQVRMAEIAAADTYRKKLATIEHASLAATLRDRLINSVTSKKNRLSRDKDMIEIGESHALLLHPSQFGHVNPSSPGGMHGKRATRNRREAEEVPSFSEGGNKRKRKAADSDESPAPNRQRIDNGSSTPLWFAEKNNIQATQLDSPLYSIEKLFTEKELAMTYNAAALAATSYMQRHHANATSDNDAPLNGKSDSSSESGKLPAILGADMDNINNEDAESVLGGTTMERQVSHATRSTRGGLPLPNNPNFSTGFGIDASADLNFPGTIAALTRSMPRLPPINAIAISKPYSKGEGANQCAGLSSEDAAAELDLIRRARLFNDEKGLGRNLEVEGGGLGLLSVVSRPRDASVYRYWVEGQGVGGRNAERDGEESEDGVVVTGLGGGVPMSKQSSRGAGEGIGGLGGFGGFNDLGGMGGTPMSRQGTGEGVTSSRGRTIKPRREALG